MTEAEVKLLLDKARHGMREGNRKATAVALRALLDGRIPAYRTSRALDRLGEYAAYLYAALVLGLDDEEEDSIEVAELAYTGLSEAATNDPAHAYELLRKRVFLLHHFPDYLADAWSATFTRKTREGRLLEARALALEALARMQLADVDTLEQRFGKRRVDDDEALNNTCNELDLSSIPSRDELSDATLMHEIFFTSLRDKHAL
jgi:hypothetical protein